ncbi:MAG: FAD-binding protein [Planctomycetes bacterium]|nr:FAD-binding protein [Planctomycetota bacterium]
MDRFSSALLERFGAERALVARDQMLAYECDGFTIHKSLPRAVVLPETTDEVQAAVRIALAHEVPFLPRGAGTCLSGGPTPTRPSLVIETARMKRVLEVDERGLWAVVQPGVVNLALTRHVEGRRLNYAPDPSSQTVCTIGGNLAENAGGPHCFKYGMTSDHVLGALVVLPDGELARLGGPAGPRAPHEPDLLGVFTGSEGTFGIATEITVRLSRDTEGLRTLLGAFASMEAACGVVTDIVARGLVPAALEILDAATIRAVEASVYRAGYPQDAAAVLLVELDGVELALDDDAAEVESIFRGHGAISIEQARDPEHRKRLWKGRKGAFGAMGRLRPDLYVLDGVVPRTRLVETLREITAIGRRHRLTLTNVFHAGDGNLHPNIAFDARDHDERARVLAAGHEILALCVAMGGSISGEHGIGSEKIDHFRLMFGEDDLDVMQRVKRAFDPRGLCNPDKVLPSRTACAESSRWPAMVARVLDAEPPAAESGP